MTDQSQRNEQLLEELAEVRRQLEECRRTHEESTDAERRLRRFEKAIETMQLGVTIADIDGMILYTNPADAEMHGYSVDELIGKGVRIFSASKSSAMSEDVMVDLRSWTREAVNVRRDLTTFPVRLMSDVVKDATGKPIGMVTTCEDITERKEAEEALRKSERDYREFVERATYGIYRASVDGRFLSVNTALVAMLGYDSKEELLSVDVGTHIYPDPAERVRLIAEYRDSERIEGIEVRWVRKDRGLITVRLSGRPICGSGGKLEGFEMIAEDVTQQRALEARLRESEKMEDIVRLTGGIAHDFNNLLTVILANAGLVASSLSQGQRNLLADLGELEDAARRGTAMVKRLMSFSRQSMLRFQHIDIAEWVMRLLPKLNKTLPITVELQFARDTELPDVHADLGADEQVLTNLVNNAKEAMPNGGLVRIDVRRTWFDDERRKTIGWGDKGEYVVISVSDTGCGMDERTAQKIFEPFFSTKRPRVGLGLGLSVAYGLMKQHRGYVDVTSGVGNGTTIKTYFRVSGEKAQPAVPAGQEEVPKGGSESILLADDEDAICRAAKRVLERFGYKVLLASDGEEALRLYQQHRDDLALVISDVVMPKMNGPELHEAIRSQRRPPAFMFMSGYTARDVQATADLDLDVPFLAKPWTATDLLRRVRQVIDKSAHVGVN